MINAAKKLILLKTPSRKLPIDHEITLNGSAIKPTASMKLLGVMIDQHPTFKEDIDRIVLKRHGLIGVLARTAPLLSTQLLRRSMRTDSCAITKCQCIRASASKTQCLL